MVQKNVRIKAYENRYNPNGCFANSNHKCNTYIFFYEGDVFESFGAVHTFLFGVVLDPETSSG